MGNESFLDVVFCFTLLTCSVAGPRVLVVGRLSISGVGGWSFSPVAGFGVFSAFCVGSALI